MVKNIHTINIKIKMLLFVCLILVLSGCSDYKNDLDIDQGRNQNLEDNIILSKQENNDNSNLSIYEEKQEEMQQEDDESSQTILDNDSKNEEIDEDSYLKREEFEFNYASIPSWDENSAYYVVNSNIPFFNLVNISNNIFEFYSGLDRLGRCGVAFANVCEELMPTEPRGEIGSIRPSGWHTENYHDLVEGNYLYNRCHLIAYQLAGENDNVCNLITGTRYLNVQGMLPFENRIEEYVCTSHGHVLYRVTPIFVEDELVARGVLMEAYSVEDQGEGICFNVFCYNVQPGIDIDYSTGESSKSEERTVSDLQLEDNEVDKSHEASELSIDNCDYVLNINTHRFHYPNCDSVYEMKEKNRRAYKGNREELIQNGYISCGRCNP